MTEALDTPEEVKQPEEVRRSVVIFDNVGTVLFKGEGVMLASSDDSANTTSFELHGKDHIFCNARVLLFES